MRSQRIIRLTTFLLLLCIEILFASCSDEQAYQSSSYSWKKVCDAPVPSPSNDRMVVYDPQRDTLVLFGGTYLQDTWEYDGEKWWRIETERSLPNVFGGCACYHSGMKVIIMFGGSRDDGTDSNQLWFYDGQGWYKFNTTSEPLPRHDAGLSYDEKRGCVVLFGGENETGLLNDTWEWKDGCWSQIVPQISPPRRSGHGQVYDPKRETTIVFGGSETLADTWTYDGSDWTCVETTETPAARFYPGMTYDPYNEIIVLIGGQQMPYAQAMPLLDRWHFDGQNWVLVQSFAHTLDLKYPLLCHRFTCEQMFLYCSYYVASNPWESYSALNIIEGHEIFQAPIIEGPLPLYCKISVAEWREMGQFLLFNSFDKNEEASFWLFDGLRWHLSSIPLPEYDHSFCSVSMVYNRKEDIILLIPDQWLYTPLNTFLHFEYSDGQWIERIGSPGPTAQRDFARAYDSNRGVLVLFGGKVYDDGYIFLNETWEYDGDQWLQRFPDQSPSRRVDSVMAYDEDRAVIVLHGGLEGNMCRRDTWEYDGRAWTKIHTPHAPITVGPMIYHKVLQRIILLSEMDWIYQWDNYFWQYDGTDWEPVPLENGTSGGPSPRYESTMAYNHSTEQVILFGGKGRGHAELADTWEFSP